MPVMMRSETEIWCYTEAVLHVPDISDEIRAAAERVRDVFLPQRDALGDSYAGEAATAKKNRQKLAEFEADLKSLPTPDSRTLYDWVVSFIDSGDKLDELLSERSTTEAGHDGKAASELRSKTIGLLRRLREALRDEVEANDALPRDLENRVFSYVDELAAARRRRKKPAAAAGGVQAITRFSERPRPYRPRAPC
jgi:hypothetical protein